MFLSRSLHIFSFLVFLISFIVERFLIFITSFYFIRFSTVYVKGRKSGSSTFSESWNRSTRSVWNLWIQEHLNTCVLLLLHIILLCNTHKYINRWFKGFLFFFLSLFLALPACLCLCFFSSLDYIRFTCWLFRKDYVHFRSHALCSSSYTTNSIVNKKKYFTFRLFTFIFRFILSCINHFCGNKIIYITHFYRNLMGY